MREIGTLVWVVLIIIGVVSSMISTIRKQAQAQGPPGRPQPQRTPPRPQSRVAPPSPAVTQPAPPPPRAQPRPPVHAVEEPRAKRKPLFAGKGSLVRAVIAAEVLGKPRGLGDEHFLR